MQENDTVVMGRLQRLISANLCDAEDPSKYVAQLKQLVVDTIDEDVVKRQARLFKALSEPLRLKILELLKTREMCLCEIMAAFNLAQPTASHHLEILEKVGVVESRREGKWVFFKLKKPAFMAHIQKISVSEQEEPSSNG